MTGSGSLKFSLRFTIRGLMAIIAATALVVFAGIETWRLYRLAREYRSRASYHASQEMRLRAAATRYHVQAIAHDQGLASFQGGPRPHDHEVVQALELLSVYADDIRKFNRSDTQATAENRITRERERVRRQMAWMAETLHAWEESALGHAEYHAQIKQKYERAARFPWLATARDPPDPCAESF